MRRQILLAFVMLALALDTRARDPVHGPWDNDPIVVASKRTSVMVHMFLEPDRFVVSDETIFNSAPTRKLWLITVSEPSTCPKFNSGNGLVLEATIHQDGSVFYAIVGWLGHPWRIPIKSLEPWTPTRT
jgi:hypothetical protein